MLSRLKSTLRALLRKSQAERDLDEELRRHIELQTEQNIRLGMNPEEARYAARKTFGGVEQAKERSRDARGMRSLEDLWKDLRYGLRMLVKNPGFTLVVTVTLALGIGANTAIFGLVDAALLRPLPVVAAPGQVVMVMRGADAWATISYPDFEVLRERNEALSGLALYTQAKISFGNGARSEVVLGSLVSANYFDVLGIKPALGRTFLPAEDHTPGAHPVVVLSHGFWRSRFNSDPALVGQTIVLNGQRFTVVGVAPAGFDGETPPMKVNLWAPVMMYREILVRLPAMPPIPQVLLSNRQHQFNAIGRLKQGVSVV